MQLVKVPDGRLLPVAEGEDVVCGAWFGCPREAAVVSVAECGCRVPVCIPCRDVIIAYALDPRGLRCHWCRRVGSMAAVWFEPLR